jgi:DNA-binding transcriptional LysR family regulator
MCIALRKDHSVHKSHKKWHLTDFKDETFITFSEGTDAYLELKELFDKVGIDPPVINAPDLATVYLLLEAGRGVGVLDASSIYFFAPFLEFIPIPEFSDVEHVVAWNKENQNPCASTFIKHIHSMIK